MKKRYVVIGSVTAVVAVLCVLMIFTGVSQLIKYNNYPSSTGKDKVENSNNVGNTDSTQKSNNVETSNNVKDSRDDIYMTSKYFLAGIKLLFY